MKNQIWKQEVLDPYELSDLTPSDIEMAAEKMGVVLPSSYVELLLEQNGGTLYLDKFPLEEHEAGYIEVDYLWGIDKKGKQGIWQTTYLLKEWDLPKGLILLNGDGNSWIALDYRDAATNPSVLYIESDSSIELTLADNFDEFICKLYRDEESNDLESVLFADIKTEYTVEEAEVVFEGGSLGDISFALYHFTKVRPDVEWLLDKIEGLLKHEDEFVVMEAEGALMDIVLNRKDETSPYKPRIEKMVEILTQHKHPDVRNYALKIEKRLDS